MSKKILGYTLSIASCAFFLAIAVNTDNWTALYNFVGVVMVIATACLTVVWLTVRRKPMSDDTVHNECSESKTITEEEYNKAHKLLMDVWNCSDYDSPEIKKQFDDNLDIVMAYINQHPLTKRQGLVYQEQLKQSNEQYGEG